MRTGSPLRHTSLGLLMEIWRWYRQHPISCGRAFTPIAESIRQHLVIECPEAVKDVQRIEPD
jgi:hypothetical protein